MHCSLFTRKVRPDATVYLLQLKYSVNTMYCLLPKSTQAEKGHLMNHFYTQFNAPKNSGVVSFLSESQSVEECGDRLKRILESPSIPQVNHQLLVHLTGNLNRISQQSQASPQLLGQAFTDIIFKHLSLRYRYKNYQDLQHFPLGNIHAEFLEETLYFM